MAVIHAKAKAIEKFLHDKPDATVQDIGEKFKMSEGEVVAILDTHYVDEKGGITHKGEGQGGGWHPARLRDKRLAEEFRLRLEKDTKIEEQEHLRRVTELDKMMKLAVEL